MGALGEYFRKEKENIKSQPKGKRLAYLWDYYKLWILGGAFVLIFGAWLLVHSLTAVTGWWLLAVFPNADAAAVEAVRDDFAAARGWDLAEKQCDFRTGLYFDTTTDGGMNNSYFQSFVAMVEAGDADAVVMTKAQIEALGRSGRLLDLADENLKELYARYADRLIYCEPYDETYVTDSENGLVPVGIDCSDSLLVTRYHVYDGDCALGICAMTGRLSEVEAFLAFILPEG